jgi:hypothetical protein
MASSKNLSRKIHHRTNSLNYHLHPSSSVDTGSCPHCGEADPHRVPPTQFQIKITRFFELVGIFLSVVLFVFAIGICLFWAIPSIMELWK